MDRTIREATTTMIDESASHGVCIQSQSQDVRIQSQRDAPIKAQGKAMRAQRASPRPWVQAPREFRSHNVAALNGMTQERGSSPSFQYKTGRRGSHGARPSPAQAHPRRMVCAPRGEAPLMMPQTNFAVDSSAKTARSGRQREGVIMFKHLLTTVALGSAVFLLTPASVARPRGPSSTTSMMEMMSDGLCVDHLPGPPVGPGIFDASSGAYHLKNGGSRPIAIGHWMGSGWTDSLVDPQFTQGFLRAKVKADTAGSLPWMWMRWSEELDGNYIFLANSVSHRFQIERVGEPYLVFPLDDPAIQFNLGEEWNIEGGTVGDQITLKVWQVGDPEPTTPQLTVIDSKYNQGSNFGVGGNVLAEALPGFLDVTFDDIYFTPSVLGDFNYSSDLDAGDIDLLSSEVHKVTAFEVVRSEFRPTSGHDRPRHLGRRTEEHLVRRRRPQRGIQQQRLRAGVPSGQVRNGFGCRLGRRGLGRQWYLRQQRLCCCVPGRRLRTGATDGCGSSTGAYGVDAVAAGLGFLAGQSAELAIHLRVGGDLEGVGESGVPRGRTGQSWSPPRRDLLKSQRKGPAEIRVATGTATALSTAATLMSL